MDYVAMWQAMPSVERVLLIYQLVLGVSFIGLIILVILLSRDSSDLTFKLETAQLRIKQLEEDRNELKIEIGALKESSDN